MLTSNELFGEKKSVSDYMLEYIIEQNQRIEELKRLSIKERQFLIFKMFYNGLSESDKNFLRASIKKYPGILAKTHYQMHDANSARLMKEISIYNREEIGLEIMIEYNVLLNKVSALANELNINNSLELSILFSYLLWNGYFSKNKKYKFQSKDRNIISGMLFTDIIDGIGVCINNSQMLKDVLNNYGYKSTIVVNHFDFFTKTKNIIDIKRDGLGDSENFLKEIINRKKANHAFNIIEEDGKLYIYDSTNLSLFNIDNSFSASIIDGKGKNKLFPYQSYVFCLSEEDIFLLDRLIQQETFKSPYTKEDFRSISDVDIEIFKNSISLLEDFYTDIIPHIVGISEKTDIKIKKR